MVSLDSTSRVIVLPVRVLTKLRMGLDRGFRCLKGKAHICTIVHDVSIETDGGILCEGMSTYWLRLRGLPGLW